MKQKEENVKTEREIAIAYLSNMTETEIRIIRLSDEDLRMKLNNMIESNEYQRKCLAKAVDELKRNVRTITFIRAEMERRNLATEDYDFSFIDPEGIFDGIVI